jgi:hypothetical protein
MERRAFRMSGFVMVVVLLVLAALAVVLAFTLQNGTAIGIAVGAWRRSSPSWPPASWWSTPTTPRSSSSSGGTSARCATPASSGPCR